MQGLFIRSVYRNKVEKCQGERRTAESDQAQDGEFMGGIEVPPGYVNDAVEARRLMFPCCEMRSP